MYSFIFSANILLFCRCCKKNLKKCNISVTFCGIISIFAPKFRKKQRNEQKKETISIAGKHHYH